MEKAQSPQAQGQAERRGSLSRALLTNSIRAVEGEERTYELSFSSEEPYRRWWGVEILDHSPGCVKMGRINDIGCLLFNHDRDEVIGRVINAWIEDGRCLAKVQFDDDGESERIQKKVASGTLKGVSVGYNVESWESVKPGGRSADGRFTGPCEIARSWEPVEISIVSVPADPTVGVGREMDGEAPKTMLALYSRQLQINKNKIGGLG